MSLNLNDLKLRVKFSEKHVSAITRQWGDVGFCVSTRRLRGTAGGCQYFFLARLKQCHKVILRTGHTRCIWPCLNIRRISKCTCQNVMFNPNKGSFKLTCETSKMRRVGKVLPQQHSQPCSHLCSHCKMSLLTSLLDISI